MLTRREFVRIGSLTAFGALTAEGFFLASQLKGGAVAKAMAAQPLAANTLTKYLDPLPLPSVKQPSGKLNGYDYYEVRMTQFTQKLHSQLPPTTLWGYDGQFPGKTFEARSNQPIYVKWINDIDSANYLLSEAYDPNLHGTDKNEPQVKTVVHVHGAHVPAAYDGHPEAWFTRNFAQTGPTFTSQVYQYTNKQEAASLWYHDHTLGQTRLNVYAGLAGLYLIRDRDENDMNLPKGKYEIPLLLQDRIFGPDGSLFYPLRPKEEVPSQKGPWIPEFFGDAILVNGKVWPYLEVEPRKYRFRIYNGANARFFNIKISAKAEQTDVSALPFVQIAAEQGFFNSPVQLNTLLLAPGERADVVVDFTGLAGGTYYLTNDAAIPFPMGDPCDPDTGGQVMKFVVNKPLSGKDTSRVPRLLRSVEKLEPERARVTRDMAIIEYASSDTDEPIGALLNGRMWDHPVLAEPKLGSTEIWNIINTTMDAHPIHLHLVRFQILDRQPINPDLYMADWGAMEFGMGPDPIKLKRSHILGPRYQPEANEKGWKDTFKVYPGEVTRVIAKFDDYTGIYAWHCHILEHEDNEMMLQYRVVP